MVVGHLVFFEEHLVFGVVLEEQVGCGLGLVFGLAGLVEVHERVERAFHAVLAFLACEHGAQREGCTHGHEHFGVFRHDGLFVGDAQAFLERADERRVEREGAALENHGRLDFHTLGETADGLLRDGVEARKGDIFLGDTVVEHGLDVRLGEHAATARNLVDLLAALGEAFEGLGLDAEEFRHLVDKCAGTASTYAVHAHVRCDEFAGSLVFFEENDLRILTAEFDGDPGFGIGGAHGEGVCDDFLYEEGVRGLGERLASATAKGDPKVFVGEKTVRLPEDLVDLFRLHGVVALVRVVQKLVGLGIDDRNLHGGGTYVHADPQIVLQIAHSGGKFSKSY